MAMALGACANEPHPNGWTIDPRKNGKSVAYPFEIKKD